MTTKRPGGYYYLGIHAGPDCIRTFTLYSEYNKATKTGTAVDLTGCSFKAEGRDSAGVAVFEVVPTAATPTNGQIKMTIPKATTIAQKGKDGEWALQVTWTDTSTSYPVWGAFSISDIVLVD